MTHHDELKALRSFLRLMTKKQVESPRTGSDPMAAYQVKEYYQSLASLWLDIAALVTKMQCPSVRLYI